MFKGTVAKSRIVAQGFRDPMLGQYRRDAPTASRLADAMCLFLIVSFQFEAFLGDIKQAFFQGKKFDRTLYLEQPKGGLRGLMNGQLLRALAGIYGFSEASRMFWMAFKECMIASGWLMSKLEMALFYLFKAGRLVALAVSHVGDVLCGCKT